MYKIRCLTYKIIVSKIHLNDLINKSPRRVVVKRIKPKHIWIDADACPKSIKEIVYKTSMRLNINIILVANDYQNIPSSNLIRMIVVDRGFDAADKHIVEHVEVHDIVITADIPLAAEVLKKNAIALDPRGKIYTDGNIGSNLSLRNFLKEFRDAGTITSGPAAFNANDIKQFSDALNRLTS